MAPLTDQQTDRHVMLFFHDYAVQTVMLKLHGASVLGNVMFYYFSLELV